LLRDISTTIYALKMLRPETDVSSSPLATALSSRQNHVCFTLCIQPNILKSKQATKTVMLTNLLKNKNRSCTCSEMLNSVPYFPCIQFSHTQLYQ